MKKVLKECLGFIKNSWKKCLMIFVSFCLIIVAFDFLMGDAIISVKSSKSFSLICIIAFTSLLMLLPKKACSITYSILYWFFALISVVQILHYRVLNTFFGVTDLTNFSEGLSFISFVKDFVDVKLVIVIGVLILTYVITLLFIIKAKPNKKNKKVIIIKFVYGILVICFVIFGHLFIVSSLGEKTKEEIDFYDAKNPRNLYDAFTNRNICMQMTQLYEYTFRDVYMYFKKNFSSDTKKMHKEIDEYFKENKRTNEENEYTGIFEDQNLILILMESVDSWLVNEDTMPTLYKLQQEGLNFSNHYASSFGGGRTFNSEFAANTGLYIPINGYNIYSSVNNDFSPSLANLFKDKGYIVNSVHSNNGSFYNRDRIHRSFGYKNSYFLKDIGFKENVFNDVTLVENDEIYSYIVPNDKFMSFVITYSAHGKYVKNNLCYEKDYKEEKECINYLAGITDKFIEKLIDRLEEDELLDDTTLVLFTDHYAYGYDDLDYLKEQKDVKEEKDIEVVPFIIWNKNIESKTITSLTDTADILPTVANMFGLDTDMNYYLGTDIFSKNHENFIYFKDYTYVSNADEDLSSVVAKKIDINDKILVSDYYHSLK